MRTFALKKLIRDEVFNNMQKLGQQVEYRVLDDDNDFLAALRDKLREEEAELTAEGSDIDKEREQLNAVQAQIELVGNPRTQKTGAFSLRIFAETVSIQDTDPWLSYYLEYPDRFPELKGEV